MPDAVATPGLPADAGALAAENVRLRTIIDALVKRAEPGNQAPGSDVKTFETAVGREAAVAGRADEVEIALRETLERRQRQFEVVGRIGQSEALVRGDVEALAREITELAAKAVGCARANVWLFNEDESELRCIDLYEAAPDMHSAGLVLHAQEFETELETIKSARYVNADDALTDSRTAGYVAGYVKPLGITSMLDVLIGASGRHFGLLCFEHVGKAHHWEPDEIAFAGQLADKIAFALGISARRQAEEKIRASEAALASAQAIAHVGSWELDVATRKVTWSAETYRLFGADPASYAPSFEALIDCIVPEDRPAFEKEYADAVAQRRMHDVEYRIRTQDGRLKWLHDRGGTIADPAGRPLKARGTVQDVTERKLVEESLLRERKLTAAMIDSVPGIFFVLDEKGNNVHFNANLMAVTGRTREELMGMNALTYIAPEDREHVRRRMGEVLQGSPSGREIGLVHTNGDVHQYFIVARPIRLEKGPGFVGMGVDVTEKLRAERLLRESEERFKGLVENTADWVWEMNPDFRYTYASPRCMTLFGYAPEELVGRSVFDFMTPEDAKRTTEETADLFAGRRPMLNYETTFIHKSGRVVITETNASPYFDAEGTYRGYRGIDRDITERKAAEAALAESRQIIDGILNSVPVRLFWKDKNLSFLGCNAAFAKDAGFADPKDVIGKDDYQMGWREQADLYRADDREVIESGRPKPLIEEAQSTPDGRKITLLTSKLPLRRPNGTIYGVLGTYLDITERKIAEDALRQERDFSSALIDGLPGILFVLDAKGRNVRFNANLAAMTGRSSEELTGMDALLNVAPEDRQRIRRAIGDVFELGQAESELGLLNRNGKTRRFHVSARRINLGDGPGLLGIGVDVTEAREAERLLRESEEKFRTVFSAATDGIFLIDPVTGAYVDSNPSCAAMLGYDRSEIAGLKIGALSSGEPPYTPAEALARIGRSQKESPQKFEWHCKAKDGRLFWAEIATRHTAFGATNLVLGTIRDIDDQKRAAAQIMQLARFDSLTGLANRRVFAEAVQQAIARAERGSKGFAVLYLDLDHFKDINDTLGHPVGDLLLKSVAERLKACVRETDTVARFGGDEFAVLAVDIGDPTDAGVLGEKILAAVSKPVTVAGNEIRSGTSVGVSVYGPDSPEAETLLAHADVALYRAKSEGRGTYRFFTDSMDADVRKRVKLDADLRAAIEQNQLFLVYQPQVEAASGRVIGVEALVRWHHPEHGIVSPDEFIPAAEKNGLIVPLGRWVLRTACRQAKAWRDAGIPPVVMGVNLSALQFKTPLELEKDIAAALAENDLPPELLELELTESVLMKASREHNDVLLRLRRKGLRVAIDDFGTGFSSLDYLRRFPVDRIKIAQVFIIDLVTAAGDAAIVKAAIGLARELGIGIIAEGVETEAQLRLLQAWGCADVQGYYFSKPESAEAVKPLLARGRIGPAKARRIGANP